jgi:Flp pilus assembly protein TadG
MRRSFRHDKRGSTTVEFAIVGWMLCMVTFAIVETGLLWWLKTGMQAAASAAARCGAIGYTFNTANFLCTNTTTTQNFAVTSAQTWTYQPVITNADVTVNGKVSNCNGFSHNFFSVTISHTFFALPPPMGNYTSLATTACYPMP